MKSEDEQLRDAREHLKRTGGQAWPSISEKIRVETNNMFGWDKVTRVVPIHVRTSGMTLLDYFAGQSIAGIRTGQLLHLSPAIAARMAYDDAEQMIHVARSYQQ